jgi:hypothetical protein
MGGWEDEVANKRPSEALQFESADKVNPIALSVYNRLYDSGHPNLTPTCPPSFSKDTSL